MKKYGILIGIGFLSACSTTSEQDKFGIASRIEEKRDAFRLCYENAKTLNHEAFKGGTVKFAWTIGADGWIQNEPKIVSDTVKNTEVTRCIAKTLQSIRFNPPPGGSRIEVSFPFKYSSD